jgi:hypothetical protein
MENKNTLRTPWTVEPLGRWPTLLTVYDCDGNVVAAAKSEEVARLIANAPATRAHLDAMLDDERRYNYTGHNISAISWSGPGVDEDEGAIEDDLLSAEEEDDPDENFLGHGPGLESMEPYQEAPDFGWGE